MLPRGRPPGPGTAEEKAAIRREKVRLNVKAYRERKKNALASTATTFSTPVSDISSPSDLAVQARHQDQDGQTVENEERTNRRTVVVRSKRCFSRRDGAAPQSPGGAIIYSMPGDKAENVTAFLSIFRRTFMPSSIQLPSEAQANSLLLTPCSPWIMKAYYTAMQQDSGALQNGLLALALVITGKQNDNENLKFASIDMHRRAVAQLRNDLVPVAASRPRKKTSVDVDVVGTFLSCLSIAMFELVSNGFSPAIMQHIKALNSLTEMMYKNPSIDTFTADLITEDFGMLETLLCIKYGISSTLRHTRKKVLSQRRELPSSAGQARNASIYGDIFDIVEELPGLIADGQTVEVGTFSETAVEQLQHIIRKLIRIQGDLDAWYMYFEVRHGSIMTQEDIVDGSTGKRGVKVYLRSYEHGAVGLYILNFHLCALDTNIEATYKLAQLHESQQGRAARAEPETGVNTLPPSPASETFLASDLPAPSNRPLSSVFHREGFLYEQLRHQRIKARTIVMQLIELMSQFEPLCVSIPGQAMMIIPCEIVKMVLDKERTRINSDLRRLGPDDHDGAVEIHRYARIISHADEVFSNLERRVRRREPTSALVASGP